MSSILVDIHRNAVPKLRIPMRHDKPLQVEVNGYKSYGTGLIYSLMIVLHLKCKSE
jgi:hypothetical protein